MYTGKVKIASYPVIYIITADGDFIVTDDGDYIIAENLYGYVIGKVNFESKYTGYLTPTNYIRGTVKSG